LRVIQPQSADNYGLPPSRLGTRVMTLSLADHTEGCPGFQSSLLSPHARLPRTTRRVQVTPTAA